MTRRIAMVGMFAGKCRDYNPGCYMIGHSTYSGLKERLPDAKIDVFCIDNESRHSGLLQENPFGIELNVFSRLSQLEVLNDTLSKYDAIVIGGDVVWGGHPSFDNDIFFLASEAFLKRPGPKVLFNCVHTFYHDDSIQSAADKLRQACARAAYVSVRTPTIQRRLKVNGICESAVYVPDCVLGMRRGDFPLPPRPQAGSKKRLGISLGDYLRRETVSLLRTIDLDQWDVTFFLFSRMYHQADCLADVKAVFGETVSYVDVYQDPFTSFALIDRFDLVVADTFHSLVAASIFGVPFVAADFESETTSRMDHLCGELGIDRARNLRLAYGQDNSSQLIEGVANALNASAARPCLETARRKISEHFAAMAAVIND